MTNSKPVSHDEDFIAEWMDQYITQLEFSRWLSSLSMEAMHKYYDMRTILMKQEGISEKTANWLVWKRHTLGEWS